MGRSVGYIIGFAVAVCLVCSLFVSSAAVALKERQDINKVLDRQKKVLTVVGLMKEGEALERAEVEKRFTENMKAHLVDVRGGGCEAVTKKGLSADAYDQRKARSDAVLGADAPKNRAGVKRIAKCAVVYHLLEKGKLKTLVLPVEGKGLWSTLYGYIALDADLNTVRGITFYEHGETPGLGGEVDNARWKALWPGRKAFDKAGKPAIRVIKGAAGPADKAPHAIDGLSGVTMTSLRKISTDLPLLPISKLKEGFENVKDALKDSIGSGSKDEDEGESKPEGD